MMHSGKMREFGFAKWAKIVRDRMNQLAAMVRRAREPRASSNPVVFAARL